jgi:type IV pilus assembly protein PilY1
MNSTIRQKLKQAIAAAALFCTAVQPTLAAVATANNIKLATEPLFLGTNPIPKVMLTISKDQQLFKKAYNDYSDLDGDGQIETTYKHSISYYGYFDPTKCYEYAQPGGPSGRFEPREIATGGLCTGMWHGNFLNWVAMTRMDAVRKLLYGGMRSTDGATQGVGLGQGTILERAYLPTDAHAYAKYYNPGAPGSDPAQQPPIDRLTPFSGLPTAPAATAATTAAFTIPAAGGDYDVTFSTGLGTFSVGDQISMSTGAASITGAVFSISGSTVRLRLSAAGIIGAGTVGTSWTVRNHSSTGISFCNLTTGASSGADQRSSTNTKAPVIRVVRGNFALWSANERIQCQWFGERSNLQGGFSGGLRSNGNQATLSGIEASAENPIQGTHGLSTVAGVNGEYIARVQVCMSEALIGTEKCRSYGNNNMLKPYGLLQEYGEDDRIHFGLLTGSFQNNTNGGVLRKNIGTFADEVDPTNGTFSNPNHYRPPGAPRGPGSAATPAGIVNTLNYMRIYGYNYAGGSYLGASGDNCTYQLTNLVPGDCTSWGNPMAEAFFESLRYFAGKSPQYGYGASSKDNELGLPQATWTDPMTNTMYCAKMNVLVFNASVSTNEDDLRNTVLSSINGTATASALTTAVGNHEGITGNTYFVGRTPASIPGATDFELCTPKAVNALGEALGICPEGPTLLGTYLIGGVAHFARTNRIRTAASLPLQTPPLPTDDTKSLKVVSYGIQLASNTPELVITAPVANSPRVVIQPIYRLHLPGNVFGGGALVDLKFVNQTWDPATQVATGKVYVNWEDSEQGGDYDQDMWGTLEWRLDVAAGTIAVTTNAISASTANPQGFGYTISGTNRDGPHFHSGILGFNFNDPSGAVAQPANVAGCTNCRLVTENVAGSQTGPQTVSYSLGATAAGSLKDPLWYLAKYGGFSDQNGNARPDLAPEWDSKKVDGTLGADGIPDNYFLVTNPLGLEQALGAALAAVVQNATAASVAANTTSLQVGSTVYAARFDPSNWSGNLEALPIRSDGSLGADAWGGQGAQGQLKSMTHLERNIYTYNTDTNALATSFRRGTRFLWNDVGADLQAFLDRSPDTGLVDNRGQQRLEYVRGDRTNETTAIGFRKRAGPLGDILNSNPVFVPEPNANIFDVSYRDFKNLANIKNRTHMVYVAANDGMLHGFDAKTGKELLAYVPSKTFSKLNQLTSPAYVNKHRAFVDGSPEVADANVNGTWKTVLVGALGVGGQGLFALDVSDPATFPTADPKQLVLWEFNDTDDATLGYVLGQPVIRKMANGKWAAIVSGGYNNSEADGNRNSAGNAFLFIIFLDGPTGPNRTWTRGTDYIRIATGVGFATSPTLQPNGLARPLAADTDADGSVNFIYAGDLQGNFWKFDVSSSNPSVWTNSSRRVVLFTATGPSVPQPITAQAEGALHPSGKGFIINFGTGKYLEEDDTKPQNFTVQSYYGIWDKNDSVTINAQTRLSGRTQLLQQVLVDKSVGSRVVREIERDPVTGGPRVPDWSSVTDGPPTANDSPAKHMGWYMDFPNSGTTIGERAVFTPLLRGGRLIFTTLIPAEDPCQFGGSSVLMVIDPATGAASEGAVIDINGDGTLNSADAMDPNATDLVYASGLKSEIGITNTPRLVARPSPTSAGSAGAVLGATDPRSAGAGIRENYGIMCGSSGACISPLLGLSSGTARVTWREVVRD